jgi:copper oxidase (laccase) domain-containing protein
VTVAVAPWLPILQTAVAALTILGVAHSVWRGTIGELIDNTNRIPHVERKVEDVEDTQEDLSDAIVLLSHAQASDHVTPDPEAIERDLRDEDEGPGRYAINGLYRDDPVEVEDEAHDPGAANRERADTAARPEQDEP